MSARVPVRTVNTSLITVRKKDDKDEYNRQYRYFRGHPEATVCPPKPDEETRGRKRTLFKYITVSQAEDPSEYHRQYNYFARNTEATVCPPRPSGKPRGPKKGSHHKKHPWLKHITVSQGEDPKEYNRQYHYFRYHTDATVCPPRGEKSIGKKNPINLNITCKPKEDHNSYRRQAAFLKKNPDADYIPQYIIDGSGKPETHKLYYN